MTLARPSLALFFAAVGALAGCAKVDAEGAAGGGAAGAASGSRGADGELRGLLQAAREELAAGRAALSEAFEGELRGRLEAVVADLEAAARRLGQEHADELRELAASEREGLARALDALESRGSASWRGARDELERGVDRLADLLERWADELEREEISKPPQGLGADAR